MFGFGRTRPGRRLKALLADYAAWAPPHLGHVLKLPGDPGPVLTPEQARENFLAYREAVPARLAVLRPLLAEFGVDLDLAYADATAFVFRLHPVLLAELPPLYRAEVADRAFQELSDRAGQAIALTLLGDLAMLTGDALIRACPGAFWGQNLDRRDRLMFSWRRPCLLGLADRLFPDAPPDIFFLEEEWFGLYRLCHRPGIFAGPEGPLGVASPLFGDTLPMRLDRYHAHPDIARLRTEGWMKDAA